MICGVGVGNGNYYDERRSKFNFDKIRYICGRYCEGHLAR